MKTLLELSYGLKIAFVEVVGLEKDRVKNDYKICLTYVTRFVVKDGEENGAGIVTWAPLDTKISKRGDTSRIAENGVSSQSSENRQK